MTAEHLSLFAEQWRALPDKEARMRLAVALGEAEAQVAHLSQEVERLKRLAETLRGKRDRVIGPWWVSFDQMLTDAERDEIGLSEDRGAVLCITRLASAYSAVRDRERALQEEVGRLKLKVCRADDLAEAVAVMVERHALDSRSPAADALLDYRDPEVPNPKGENARLRAELEEAKAERLTLMDILDAGRMYANDEEGRPTTVIERAENVVVALGAETSGRREFRTRAHDAERKLAEAVVWISAEVQRHRPQGERGRCWVEGLDGDCCSTFNTGSALLARLSPAPQEGK